MRWWRWLRCVWKSKLVKVVAIRKLNKARNRSGQRPYFLLAVIDGRVAAMQGLSATFSPLQYEKAVSKVLAKVYLRYKWLVSQVEYLPTLHQHPGAKIKL